MDSAWNLEKKNLQEIVAEVGNIKISVADFKTIQPRVSREDQKKMCRFSKDNGGDGVFQVGWLNDQVINASFRIMQIEGEKEGRRVMCTNTFLFGKLRNESQTASLKRWINKENFLKSELILVPVHKNGNHWILGAIKMKEKVLAYYDSENRDPMPSFFEKMSYCCFFSRKLLSTLEIDLQGWRDVCPKSPQQTDSSSCGVFTIENAKRLVHGRPLDFKQEDAEELRYDIAISLLGL